MKTEKFVKAVSEIIVSNDFYKGYFCKKVYAFINQNKEFIKKTKALQSKDFDSIRLFSSYSDYALKVLGACDKRQDKNFTCIDSFAFLWLIKTVKPIAITTDTARLYHIPYGEDSTAYVVAKSDEQANFFAYNSRMFSDYSKPVFVKDVSLGDYFVGIAYKEEQLKLQYLIDSYIKEAKEKVEEQTSVLEKMVSKRKLILEVK